MQCSNALNCCLFEGVVAEKSEASLESMLVDRAIEGMMSLPEVVGEVALKQREQGEELRNQQQQLIDSTVGAIILILTLKSLPHQWITLDTAILQSSLSRT